MDDVAVIFFAFNRPDKLARLHQSFERCMPSQALHLYIFIDGAREEAEGKAVRKVFEVAQAFDHPKKTIITRDRNLGLKSSLRTGISEVLEKHESVIVLEDDLVLGSHALDYFQSALNRYKNKPQVVSICGYCIGENRAGGIDKAGFLPMTHPWGWATWRDRWQAHIADLAAPPVDKSAAFRTAMNVFGLRNFTQMLGMAERGLINSWWIYWHRDAVRRHQLSLFPTRPQVINAGIDGTGTHVSRWNFLARALPERLLADLPEALPTEIMVDFAALQRAIASREAKLLRVIGFLGSVRRKLRRMLKR